jgi:hypothetical protein
VEGGTKQQSNKQSPNQPKHPNREEEKGKGQPQTQQQQEQRAWHEQAVSWLFGGGMFH